MSDTVPKVLFFIKSPTANIAHVELFLKKRGFTVYSESNLKIALLEIFNVNPDYIFIATDHPTDSISNLPKIITQSLISNIIYYCTSNDKNQTRKLQQSSGQKNKLFPPLSGPAIQRLISKNEKENSTETSTLEKNKSTGTSSNNATEQQIKKTALRNKDLDNFIDNFVESERKPAEIYIDKGQRAKELRHNQSILNSSGVLYLSPVQDIVSSTQNKLSQSLKTKLNNSFTEQTEIQMAEMVETFSESSATEEILRLKNKTLEAAKFGYCLIVEHLNWCGYLIVASEDIIEPASLDTILTTWLNENIRDSINSNTAESASTEVFTTGFEVTLSDVSFEKFSEQFADYSKTIQINDHKTMISFFSQPPEAISLQIHDLHDMIQVLTEEIPVELPIPFDLHLYLPENKKFILYYKKDSSVANIQIDRLKEKKVSTLYTSLDYENAIRKFRAKARIQQMIHRHKDNQKK